MIALNAHTSILQIYSNEMSSAEKSSSSEHPTFPNQQEEIEYWKKKLSECQIEFQEFQESSCELEQEYETQFKQLEKRNNESTALINRLEAENEHLKSKYNSYVSETRYKLNEYQKDIIELKETNNRLTTYIRELEQSNDDLERAKRALAASLDDFESQLNQQIERNVLLENEISGKDELECLVQRLKEETRDLQHELQVKKNAPVVANRVEEFTTTSVKSPSNHGLIGVANLDSHSSPNGKISDQWNTSLPQGYLENETTHKADSTTPLIASSTQRFSYSSPTPSQQSSSAATASQDSKSQQTSPPLSPINKAVPVSMTLSSRISALNIVSDLLRKIGALETKLASAKKMTG